MATTLPIANAQFDVLALSLPKRVGPQRLHGSKRPAKLDDDGTSSKEYGDQGGGGPEQEQGGAARGTEESEDRSYTHSLERPTTEVDRYREETTDGEPGARSAETQEEETDTGSREGERPHTCSPSSP